MWGGGVGTYSVGAFMVHPPSLQNNTQTLKRKDYWFLFSVCDNTCCIGSVHYIYGGIRKAKLLGSK